MKRRAIAIGSVVAISLGILAFTQAANAAEAGCDVIDTTNQIVNPCPKDEGMKLCKGSLKINGEDQESTEFAQTFPADTCDFKVTEVLGADDGSPIFGAPFNPTNQLVNCPPNVSTNPALQVDMEAGSARISGDFVNENDTFAASFVGLIGVEWTKHTTKSILSTEVKTVRSSRTVNVPEGMKGTFSFFPRRAQIKGIWTVTGGTRNNGGSGPFGPENVPWEATFESTIDAPLLLPNGGADGEAKPDLEPCTGDEFEGDNPEDFPSEPPN